LRNAAAPRRRPTSLDQGWGVLFLLLGLLPPKPGILEKGLGLSEEGGRVVCWMRANSAVREGYLSKRRAKVVWWSRRML
jgi:hypothetical protein